MTTTAPRPTRPAPSRPPAPLPYRRRVENSILRMQGRLDTVAADSVVPWVYAVVLFLILWGLAMARYRSLENGIELANYVQAAWLVGEGFEPSTSIRGGHLFANQAGLLFWPLAQIARFVPTAPLLLGVQSFALASTIVPLYRIARRVAKLRAGAATAIVFLYSLYPPMHDLNLADFHIESLAVPALVGMVLASSFDRWGRFAVFAVIVVAARADLATVVACYGILLIVQGKRRPGILTAVLSVLWLLAALLWLQPELGDDVLPHVQYFTAYGDSPMSVLWGMVTSPVQLARDVLSRSSFNHLVGLFAPLLFLPFVAPRYFLPVVPIQIFYLAAELPADTFDNPQQDVPAIALLFVAATIAVARTGRLGVERVNVDRRILGALLVTAAVFFTRDALSTPYNEPWGWASRDASDQARRAAVELVPTDAAVQTSESTLTAMAERSSIHVLDTSSTVIAAERSLVDAEFILFDEAGTDDWSTVWLSNFDRNIQRRGYAQVYRAAGVTLYQRIG